MSSTTVTPDQYTRPIGPRNDLLYRVQRHLEKYVAFANPHHAPLLALWVLHTHAFDAFYVTPYIYVSSIDPGAGKTTLMETVSDLARTPASTANVTASGIFRKIEADRPTLLIDEVDAIYSGARDENLRSILNSGYLRNGKATRTVGGESVDFSTFCPKLLGGIDNAQLPATILDRSIRVRLRKLGGDQLAALGITRRNFRKLERDEYLAALKKELSKWATVELIDKLADIEPQMIEGLSARQWEIAEPLMQVAHLFHRHEEARETLIALFQGEKVETEEMRILSAAQELFAETTTDRITTGMLAEVVGYTPERLSRLLSPLGIKARPMKIGGGTVRGYFHSEFEAAWEKYL